MMKNASHNLLSLGSICTGKWKFLINVLLQCFAYINIIVPLSKASPSKDVPH